jgi:hypothetical protein
MTAAIINLETKEQINLFRSLAKVIGVSFEVLPKTKEKKLDAIETSRQEARNGQVYHYDDIEEFFKKMAI